MLIRDVISGTFFQLKIKRTDLAKALLIPLLLSVLLESISEFNDTTVASLLFLFIDSAIQTIIAIATHRIILLGHDSVSEWGIRSWSKRETTFFVHYSILLGISYAGIYTLPIIGFNGFSIFATMLAWLWVWSRLSLVFPAIAVEHPFSFRDSWNITKHYQPLMLFLVLILPLLLAIPVMILSLLPMSELTVPIAYSLNLVIGITALSISYHSIMHDADNGSIKQ